MSAHNCILLMTVNYCLSCRTSWFVVWNFYYIKSVWPPSSKHTPKSYSQHYKAHTILPYHSELHTFNRKYGQVILIIIQLSLILKKKKPAVCAQAVKSVWTSPIISPSKTCVLASPCLSSILTFYSTMDIGRFLCPYFMTWWRTNTYKHLTYACCSL